jgi:ABC-type transport system involved in multi-copper enzyme maturation permease subunit
VIGLIPAEFRRQIGRKGSFYGAMGAVGLAAIGHLIWAILSDNDTGNGVIDTGTGLIFFIGVLAAIVVGATAGSYDSSQGTMRYLVLTGRPRWQLVVIRPIALFGTIALFMLPAIVLTLITALIAPGPGATGEMYFDLFWVPWLGAWCFGVLSLAIGTFLNSPGVAIAVAIVLNISGLLLTGLIYDNVSQDLAKGFFPVVLGVVLDRQAGDSTEPTFSVAASSALLVIWLSALIGAAWARVQRAEY